MHAYKNIQFIKSNKKIKMKTSSILLEENILSTYLNESNSLSKLTRFLKQKEEIN